LDFAKQRIGELEQDYLVQAKENIEMSKELDFEQIKSEQLYKQTSGIKEKLNQSRVENHS